MHAHKLYLCGLVLKPNLLYLISLFYFLGQMKYLKGLFKIKYITDSYNIPIKNKTQILNQQHLIWHNNN